MARRVLVVDDEAHVVHVMLTKFRSAGIEVIVAMDAEEAFEAAVECHPDLIITDYRMPGMNGLDLCRRLFEDVKTRDIPAMLVTAHGYYIPQDITEPNQICAVISKPFSPREMLSKVNSILEDSPA
jgi:CheY-like chemotaxis protein